jgi:hydrogenase-4 component F
MIHAYQLVVLIPYVAALILVAVPGYRVGAVVNVVVSLATFAAGLWLVGGEAIVGDYAIVDELNIVFIAINTLVGFTTALFSASYIGHEIETGRLSPSFVRFYHAMFQAMMGSMNLALIANNIGVMWVGLELATLITVVMVGLYRTPQAIEAAWKYFILASVGISLAFFGTILIYLAGQPALGEGMPAMTWSLLQAAAARMDPAILDLAFIFLLIGYGTKVGLAPLHAWLPDAHAEGPTPISAVLSGLLLNVALYALLRFKMLVAGQPAALDPGPVMVVMGLVSLIFAAFMLYQRRDIKRLFAYSSIEHMGLIVFAFGMGGPLANFAGLLHMAMHSLTKSGIFFAVGHIAQAKGTQRIAEIKGLSVTHPRLAVVFALAVLAICGMPPFGVFTSEFLILTTTFAREPWLALLPAFGLLIGFGALLMRLQDTMFGEPVGPAHHVRASSVPMVLHLLLVLAAGIFLPPVLVAWFQRAAELLGGASHATLPISSTAMPPGPMAMSGLRSTPASGRLSPRAVPRACMTSAHYGQMAARCAWLSATAAGACAPSSRCRPAPANILRSPPITRRRCASSAPCATSMAFSPSACPTRGPGSTTAAGPGGRARRATNFCRPRARACTRYRSGRCMPASSSRATSVSPPMARRSCGSRRGWVTCTRASKA